VAIVPWPTAAQPEAQLLGPAQVDGRIEATLDERGWVSVGPAPRHDRHAEAILAKAAGGCADA
jgi:hypothetical protein